MTNPFVDRLRRLSLVTGAEAAALDGLCRNRRDHAADRTIVQEGETPDALHIVMRGWAARQKLLPDGRRHFGALHIAGDLCDVDSLHVRRLDYGVVTLTACSIAVVSRAELIDLVARMPGIARAISFLAFMDNAAATMWNALLGRTSARERIAHLFCELWARSRAAGVAEGDSFHMPVTQEELADATGLTSVHVNRIVQSLRAENLVRIEHYRVTLPDPARLAEIGGFSPGYLHLDGIRQDH